MRTQTPLVAVSALALAAAMAVVAACDDPELYVYTAQRFDEGGACLEEYGALETVRGAGASVNCNPRCLAYNDAVYVSTVCPPLPDGVEELAADAEPCVFALRAPTCADEGEDGEDGSADGDGGVERPEDAVAPPDDAVAPPDDGGSTRPRDSGADG